MDIEKKVKSILAKSVDNFALIDQIMVDEDLFMLGMDSISAVRVIIAIENEFGFEFSEEDLVGETVKDIRSIVRYIASKISI